AALAVVARGARRHHVLPRIQTAARDRDDMVPGQKLTTSEVGAVAAAVLASVAVAGEQEGVGDLAAELAGDVDESFQSYDGRTLEGAAFRMKNAPVIHFEDFGFLVDHEAKCPFDGQNRQRLERRIQRKYAHTR